MSFLDAIFGKKSVKAQESEGGAKMSELDYLKAFEETAAQYREIAAKSRDEAVPMYLEYSDKPLKWWFNHWAEKNPDKPYIIMGDMKLTYAYCNDVSRRFANALIDLGVKEGDRVAVMAPNVPQYVLAQNAIYKMGAIEVPANVLYTVPELTYQMTDSGTETVVVMAAFAAKAIAMLQNPDCPVKRVIAFQLPTGAVEVPQMEGVYDFNQLVGTHGNEEPAFKGDKDTPVKLQYTGGTTGVPKGCVLTNWSCFTMHYKTYICASQDNTLFTGEDMVTLGAIPLNHVYGFNMNHGICTVTGGSMILIPQPNPDAMMAEIVKNKPTFFAAVPAMLLGLNNHPSVKEGTADMSSLRTITCGSAPCPKAVFDEFERLSGGKILEGYGLSETSNIITANPLDFRKNGSVGIPTPDTDIIVVDAATGTKVMGIGETGELICRGTQIMKEYWQKPEETEATIRNGWLYTGDIVTMDEDGFFTIQDRKKDIIIVNGFNVFPKDIDEVIFKHPAVHEAGAIGVPHPTKGEAPVLFIVLKEGATLEPKEAEEFLRKELAPYKIPVDYVFVNEIPRTAVGKVDRIAMKKAYLEK